MTLRSRAAAALLALFLAPSAAHGARGEDLAEGRPVASRLASGDVAQVTRGRGRPEGEKGSAAHAAVLKGPESALVVDLGATREIHAVVAQCDSDDVYMIERSQDGQSWTGLLKIEAGLAGAGLRTHHAVLPQPVPARFLAVHAEGGDGSFFVSRLSAFAVLPTPWPPAAVAPVPSTAPTAAPAPAPAATAPLRGMEGAPPPPSTPRETPLLTEPRMSLVKALLAAAGAALLLWGALLSRRGTPRAYRRTRDALLAALGVLGLASWWNLGHFHFEAYTHLWDTFHYYMGAKYAPELRYTGLYECAVAGEVAAHRLPPSGTVLVRNLLTNHLEPLDTGDAARRCGVRFSPERWAEFRGDLDWFRVRTPGGKWQEILSDHGYNGTPAWAILGRLLAATGPASSTQIALLTSIDSLLLLAMWGTVWWAFGWRAACAGLLFWGTNFPGRYWWNGGAFLRMDWLFCLVAGVCLLRRGRPRAGGALLALATLFRVFPGAVFLGLAAAAAGRWARERRVGLTADEKRIAAGALLAGLAALPLSIAAASGPGAVRWNVWGEFLANSRKHLATPLTNDMGLRTVLAYRPSTRAAHLAGGDSDPFARWKAAHVATSARMKPLLILLSLGALAWFAKVFGGRPAWLAAAAAVGLVPVTTELTCYYYSALALLAVLWVVREELGSLWAAVACLTCVAARLWTWEEDRYFAMSLLVLAGVALTWWLAGRPAPAAAQAIPRAERRRVARRR